MHQLMHMQMPMQPVAAADSKPLQLPHTPVTASLPAVATLGPTSDTAGRTRAHMPLPALAAPVLNHTPFAQRSTAQQAGHRLSTHWPLPPLAQATHTQVRGPCRPSGRLAMTDGMDRCSGAPPLHLGWVRRGARPSGGARTHARGQRRRRRAKRPATQPATHHARPLAARTPVPHVHMPRVTHRLGRAGRGPRSSVWSGNE